MAQEYRAVTPIRHGAADGSVKEFAVGETVEGLTKAEMRALWDAGALEMAEAEAEEAPKTSTATTLTPATTTTGGTAAATITVTGLTTEDAEGSDSGAAKTE